MFPSIPTPTPPSTALPLRSLARCVWSPCYKILAMPVLSGKEKTQPALLCIREKWSQLLPKVNLLVRASSIQERYEK